MTLIKLKKEIDDLERRITYLQKAVPNVLDNLMNLSDLSQIGEVEKIVSEYESITKSIQSYKTPKRQFRGKYEEREKIYDYLIDIYLKNKKNRIKTEDVVKLLGFPKEKKKSVRAFLIQTHALTYHDKGKYKGQYTFNKDFLKKTLPYKINQIFNNKGMEGKKLEFKAEDINKEMAPSMGVYLSHLYNELGLKRRTGIGGVMIYSKL